MNVFFNLRPTLQEVEIPQVGKIYLRKLSLRQKLSFADSKDNGEMVCQSIICSVVDSEGKPLFTQADKDRILDLDSEIILSLVEKISQFNAFELEDTKKKS